MQKRVVFIANTPECTYKLQKALSKFEVEVSAGHSANMDKLLGLGLHPDIVILEIQASMRSDLKEVLFLIEDHGCPLLLVVDEQCLDWLQLPEAIPYDFVMRDAGCTECVARIRRLLGSEKAGNGKDIVAIEGMTINLATYQVSIANELVDFTYLEYALLSFLVLHPNRTFSRETLLQNVWGFDYYGGPRTVDVHVRRVRAKVGPKLAQHLETVRGVGYLWRSP